VLKTVKLALNAFPSTPPSLQLSTGEPASAISVDLADLYHHYYIDSRAMAPPDPDPAHFEHVRHLMSCNEFRFQRHGLGVNKTFKGNKSNELGQAFARWFLDKHLDMLYVAHIDEVRDHAALPAFGGYTVETNLQADGDAPDYFCVTPSNGVCLAEAKGSLKAVGFASKQFQTWRDQFNRVLVKDPSGIPLSVKGYIAAMRWAMEDDSPNIRTTLSVEDPATEGRRQLGPDDARGLMLATKSLHYAASLRRLRQPLMAAALLRGATIPSELTFNGVVWRCSFPGFEKLRFVGGYFPGDGGTQPFSFAADGTVVRNTPNPLRLDVAAGTFVGIELHIFKILADTARRGPGAIGQLERAPLAGGYYSGLSYLRDGHMLGPIEFFEPEQGIVL
jgi:hypothetical protein